MSSSKTIPSKTTLALAEALKRGRDQHDSRPKATTDEICKMLGAERVYSSKGNEKPSTMLFFGRKDA